VLAYREPGGAPFAGVYSPFATGQVFWALALMHLTRREDLVVTEAGRGYRFEP